MNPPRLYEVFVSSTYIDNIERRKLVQEAITQAGMVWHGMEIFTASTHPTVEECVRHAREADVLVGIIAHRYGWIPESSDISITELEYDAARERLMFVLDSTVPVVPDRDFDAGPECLAHRLGGRIRTEMRLTRIDACGDAFRLKFATGETATADFVIVTIPFPVLRHVVLDVPMPRQLRRFIDEFDLGGKEKLIAGFEERAWRQPGGFIGEAWTDLGYAEVWDETQRQPKREDGALTFFLGGREVGALGKGSASSVGRSFVRGLDPFTPGVEASSTGRFLATHWGQSPFTRGAYANFKPGQLTRFGGLLWIESEVAEERQEVHAGHLILAGEHLSDAFYGFMNGAAETGRLAADFVLRRMAGLEALPDREARRGVA